MKTQEIHKDAELMGETTTKVNKRGFVAVINQDRVLEN